MIRLLIGSLAGWALAIAIAIAVPSLGFAWGILLGFLAAGAGGFVAAAVGR